MSYIVFTAQTVARHNAAELDRENAVLSLRAERPSAGDPPTTVPAGTHPFATFRRRGNRAIATR